MITSKEIIPFGYLLTLDLYGCRPDTCTDISLCYQFLEDLVVELQMEKQSPPFIFLSDKQKYPDKSGVSGWVPLIESGVQIHTLSEKNFVSIDIYSCRKFSTDHIKEFVKNYFVCKEVEMHFIERGLQYHEVQE